MSIHLELEDKYILTFGIKHLKSGGAFLTGFMPVLFFCRSLSACDERPCRQPSPNRDAGDFSSPAALDSLSQP